MQLGRYRLLAQLGAVVDAVLLRAKAPPNQP